MQHFDSREEYYDAVDELIRENRHGLVNAGDIARATVVAYYADADLLTTETGETELEAGWCPMSILEQSEQSVEDVMPEQAKRHYPPENRHQLSASDAAYFKLRKDIETRADDVLAEVSDT